MTTRRGRRWAVVTVVAAVMVAAVVVAAVGTSRTTVPATAPTAPTAPPGTAAPTGPTGTSSPPVGGAAPRTLLEITSTTAWMEAPTAVATFTVAAPTTIATIADVHRPGGTGDHPGSIGLLSGGTMFGPWPATAAPATVGLAATVWTARPGAVVPAGTYQVVDSDPGTWAVGPDTAQRGLVTVTGS